MSFSNLQFLFYFLPLFFAAYYLLPFQFKNAGLVLGSALFYFWGAGAQDALLLGAVILLHYGLARLMAGEEPGSAAKPCWLRPWRRTCCAWCISNMPSSSWRTGTA